MSMENGLVGACAAGYKADGMKTKTLGGTGLRVSEICLGTMQFGWYLDEPAAFGMMDFFVDAGGNFLDTADMYSNWAPNNPGGVSEQMIGRWMKARGNRSRIVLATKCRGTMWAGPDGGGLTRSHILRACEESLRRLGTDTIDVYQAHWDDEAVPQEETMGAFDALVRDGKVRFVGCSNFSAGRLSSAVEISNRGKIARYTVIQPQYNLVYRSDFESATRAVCLENKIASIPYSPLGGGLLTGKFHASKHPGSSHRSDYITRYAGKDADRVILRLMDMARSLEVLPHQLALRWIMEQPTVAAPIIGASSNDQLADLLAAPKLNIGKKSIEELTRFSAPA